MIYTVAGCSYGDEGKGLVTDYLSAGSKRALVIRHNGGAQSGHTVVHQGKRFVFHELSSGSFRHADTCWARTFFPDLYKLKEEAEAFRETAGFLPRIFVSPLACITTLDDVLLNMVLETLRGEKRHGSCGMGINEADLRGKAGFGIRFSDLAGMDVSGMHGRLKQIRENYTALRLRKLLEAETAGMQRDASLQEYLDLLRDDAVLENYAREVLENLRYITIAEDFRQILCGYTDLIFECGQGLLLDAQRRENWPHVTASRTGITNPLLLAQAYGCRIDECFYVTRSYLTKHGAGMLPNEFTLQEYAAMEEDCTNRYNPWQGNIRYAKFQDISSLVLPVSEDLAQCRDIPAASLVVTHLNETGGKILLKNRELPFEELAGQSEVRNLFGRIFGSETERAEDIRRIY